MKQETSQQTTTLSSQHLRVQSFYSDKTYDLANIARVLGESGEDTYARVERVLTTGEFDISLAEALYEIDAANEPVLNEFSDVVLAVTLEDDLLEGLPF